MRLSKPQRELLMTMLREHRLLKGLTLAGIAGRIHVSKAAVSAWETGRNTPHPKFLPRIAKHYGIPIRTLILALHRHTADAVVSAA
jgi:transcriptional regulator with XRE-family HTH domain